MTADGYTPWNGRGGFTDGINSLNRGRANELRANGLWARASPSMVERP